MADGESVPVPLAVKTSDLKVRSLSAIVMLVVAGGALWAGGWFWLVFCVAVALGVLWEWRGLAARFSSAGLARVLWILGGIGYVTGAVYMLLFLRYEFEGAGRVLSLVGAVIATDIGAYFAGRTIGGPKIAPRISPSKTWAGLIGGMLGASAAVAGIGMAWDASLCTMFYPIAEPPPGQYRFDGECSGIISLHPREGLLLWAVVGGSLIAVIAQAGDFFESWMKRKAGVKDSGNLIPGHGGIFDRVDGLLAVCFVIGLLTATGAFS